MTYANIASSLALFLTLTTGTVYAANEWTGANIVDESLTFADLALNTVGSARIKDDSLAAIDLASNSVNSSEIALDAVGAGEIALGAVGSAEIATDGVTATEIADGSIDGGEIINNSLSADDLAAGAVGISELAGNAVDSARVANNTLRALDLAGAQVAGQINVGAGLATGRCVDIDTTVAGAKTGDAVIFSINGSLPQGILIYGVRVPQDGHVTMKVCNLSGGVMGAIVNLPVSVVTITL